MRRFDFGSASESLRGRLEPTAGSSLSLPAASTAASGAPDSLRFFFLPAAAPDTLASSDATGTFFFFSCVGAGASSGS